MDQDELIPTYIEANPYRPGAEDVRLRVYGIPVWALIGHLHGIAWDFPRTARDYRIPVEAVHAAVAYYKSIGQTFPSVDAKMAECVAKPADQVNACFAELDKYLMETAVPWVPWNWGNNLIFTSPTVTQYVYDDFSGEISFSHTAVNNGLKPVNVA